MSVRLARIIRSLACVVALALSSAEVSAKLDYREYAESMMFVKTRMNEVEVRWILSGFVKDLVAKGDFETLEYMAEQLRDRDPRTSSGLPKLSIFDEAIYESLALQAGTEAEKQTRTAFAEQWVAQYPSSTTAHLAQAQLLMQMAWKQRGNGYADEVASASWGPFLEHVELARKYLEDHDDMRNDDPRWDNLLLEIAMVQGMDDEGYDALAMAAFERNPAYYPLYFSATRRYLPKWAGSLEMLEEFATKVAAFTADEEGQALYARIYWSASHDQSQSSLYNKTSANWETMRQGFEDILEKYPDAWNTYHFALFACAARDDETAARLVKKFSKKGVPNKFPDRDRFKACKERLGHT